MAKAKSRRFKYHLAAKKRQDEKSATAIGKQNVSGDINEINAGQGQVWLQEFDQLYNDGVYHGFRLT